MERSRRKTLASIAGVIMVAGCGQPEASLTDGEQSTPGSDVNRFTDGQMAGSTGPDVSFDELLAQYDADIYVVVRNEEFSALDANESELAQGTNLGRVINEAAATISAGLVVVAANGSLSVPIEQVNPISITGLDEPLMLTPAEDVDDSYSIHQTTVETNGGGLESFGINMQYRGGPAISAENFAGLTFDDLRIGNVGEHGMVFSNGRSVDVRNTLFDTVSRNAIQVTNCADVQIDGCESTVSNQAVSISNSSNVTISDVTARDAEYSAIGLYDYTENWEVTGCRAINSGRTAFSASVARNGSFVDCVAEGTTTSQEAGFEIEYKADSDEENVQNPIVGCSVESCTARDCSVGFYAREDDSRYNTNTPIVGPQFVDCRAEGCDTGLYIGNTVGEAVVENFEAVDCDTDIVDNGVRTVIDGRSENVGDPSTEGEWFGHADRARELGVVIEDTESGVEYAASTFGGWELV